MSLSKGFKLNDLLVEINPEYNGGAYAIGFTFNDTGDYVITYNKGQVSKIVATIPADLFNMVSAKYLAHMYRAPVEMIH